MKNTNGKQAGGSCVYDINLYPNSTKTNLSKKC